MLQSFINQLFALGLLAGCTLGCAPSASKRSMTPSTDQPNIGTVTKPPNSGNSSPNFSEVESPIQLLDKNFDEIRAFVKSQQGSVVVVDMWATWCPPCVKEFPNLVKLQANHDLKDLVCISLSFDHQGIDPIEDDHKTVLEFLQKKKARIFNILSIEESEVLSKKFGIASIPVVDVYDRKGNLVKRFDESSGKHDGYVEIEKLVSDLITAE